MFTSDLNAGVVAQVSPPPHDLERLRTTMVNFIVLSIKLVFMVLGVSYSRVLAQRPTGCCSASIYNTGCCDGWWREFVSMVTGSAKPIVVYSSPPPPTSGDPHPSPWMFVYMSLMAVLVSMVIEHDVLIVVPISPTRKWFSASVCLRYIISVNTKLV